MLWNKSFGVAVSHRTEMQTEHWPHAVEDAAPNTWATVATELVPYIDDSSPGRLTVGDSNVVLDVFGLRFGEEATLRWDGVGQTTVVSDTSTLSVALNSALVTDCRRVRVDRGQWELV